MTAQLEARQLVAEALERYPKVRRAVDMAVRYFCEGWTYNMARPAVSRERARQLVEGGLGMLRAAAHIPGMVHASTMLRCKAYNPGG